MPSKSRKPERQKQYRSKAFKEWAGRIAANTRRFREERGWTQSEAAEACDMEIRQFQNVESGKTNLTLTTLARLSKGFEVDPSELLQHAVALPRRTPGRPPG